METKVLSTWPVVILLVLTYIIGAVTMGYFNQPAEIPAVPTASEIASKIVIPTATIAVPTVDNETSVKIDNINTIVSKDDNWEVQAEELATDEWTHNEYDDIFDFLVANNVSIIDKEDISRVVVIDSDITGADADDEDADVYQELKVYYEDSVGEHAKAYIDADTEIDDGDVENQEFILA